MTDPTRDTIPAPRASSLPPEKTDRELLLDALVILRRMDSELAQHGIQLTEAADERATIRAMLGNLSDGLLDQAAKVVGLREENRRANVARCEDCPIREAL